MLHFRSVFATIINIHINFFSLEMSYLRESTVCGVTRWGGERNEIYGMGPCANGMKCSVVEWRGINKLRWFGHKKSEEFVRKVYVSETL